MNSQIASSSMLYARLSTMFLCTAAVVAVPVSAQQVDTSQVPNPIGRLDPIVVLGRPLPNSRAPASTSVLTPEEISRLPVVSYGDLFRALPGMAVNNYAQGALPYGISIRGFDDGAHGKSVATFVDGVPLNEGSGANTHGWVDLNILPPEMIQSAQIVRGPFAVQAGDYAQSGSLHIQTVDNPDDRVSLTTGSYGYVRGLGITGLRRNGMNAYIAAEGVHSDGYRENGRDDRANLMLGLTFPFLGGESRVRAQAYDARSGAPGYLPLTALLDGSRSERDAFDRTDGFDKRQSSLVFNHDTGPAGDALSVTSYIVQSEFARYANFTGSQSERRSNQRKTGVEIRRTLSLGSVGLMGGVSYRREETDSDRYNTVARQRIRQTRDRDIDIGTPALYGEVQWLATPSLNLMLGARYDRFSYDVTGGQGDAQIGGRHVHATPSVVSPKVGLAYDLGGMELFVNVAHGFRSPSGFAELALNPGLDVSKLKSRELGLKKRDTGSGDAFSVTIFDTRQTNEIGDPTGSGVPVNFGLTRRRGTEVEYRKSFDRAALFGNYTRVQADILDGAPGSRFVPGVPSFKATLGADWKMAGGFTTALYAQRIGGEKLNESGRLESGDYTRLAGKLAWQAVRTETFITLVAYPGNSRFQETQFDLGNGIVSADAKPRLSAQIGVSYRF